jgi:hypothetical protein
VGHALIVQHARYVHKSVVKNLKGDHLQDQGFEGSILLKYIFNKYGVGFVEYVQRAKHRDQRRSSVTVEMNLPVPHTIATAWLLDSQEIFSFME